MTLYTAINKTERLQSNLKGSSIHSMRDLLDFAEQDLADIVQSMIEAQNTIEELTRQLNSDYPDELRIEVYEHNQAIEERVAV